MVHGLANKLKTAAIDLNEDQLCLLNDTLTSFLSAECGVSIKESISFSDLREEQFTTWLELARTAQVERGDNPEEISTEDAVIEAEQLYELNGRLLPESAKPSLQESLPKGTFEDICDAEAILYLVDFENGDTDAAELLKTVGANAIYTLVYLAGSLSFKLKGKQYNLSPKCRDFVGHEMQVLEDVRQVTMRNLQRRETLNED